MMSVPSNNTGRYDTMPSICEVLFPSHGAAPADAQKVLQPLIEHLEPSALDCLTIRDLLKYAGCPDDLPLDGRPDCHVRRSAGGQPLPRPRPAAGAGAMAGSHP